MKKLGEKLRSIVDAEANNFNLFVVHHTVSPTGLFRFYVDSAEVLSMKDLADFTRQISTIIDESDFGDTPFTFEISSPGADKPLTDIRQFPKHVGRNFEVETNDGESFKGKLESIEEQSFHFQKEIKEKGKKLSYEALILPYSSIKQATIIISFK
jgi:ribosome maturation factor RimP